MRKPLFLASLFLATVSLTGSALAQNTPPPAPEPTPTTTAPTTTAPTATTPSSTSTSDSSITEPMPLTSTAPEATHFNEGYRRVSLGAEAQMLIPMGDLSEGTGLLLGPVVRFGFRVARPFELTASAGYIFGLTKGSGTEPLQGNGGLNIVPLMVGGRFFFFPDAEKERESDRDRGSPSRYSGLYLSTEIGLNLLIPKAEVGGTNKSIENLDTRPRFGGNFGLGYIISKRLPIDVRAQFSLLNLFGKEDQVAGVQIDEKTLYGLGVSLGYTHQF